VKAIDILLNQAIEAGIDDVHLKVGFPPMWKPDLELQPMPDRPALDQEALRALFDSLLDEEQHAYYQENREVFFKHLTVEGEQFDGVAYEEKGELGAVFQRA
jgi:twitching motility protein PilT